MFYKKRGFNTYEYKIHVNNVDCNAINRLNAIKISLIWQDHIDQSK